ncbi:MAG: hypothetical protein IKH41_09870 [Clostridia bacterium]|nr:hypothetical protein [Clostridia bacterium]
MDNNHSITRIKPDLSDRGFIFEPGLFGINMEVTRKGFFRGINAQMLNNRKLFAGTDGVIACENVKNTYLHDTDEGLEFYKDELLAEVWEKVRICVDEWNFCWGSGSNNALLISNALQLHFFGRNADKYHIREARFFMTVNEGMITVSATGSKVESSGKLFRFMAGHKGGNVVSCASDDSLDVLCTRHDGYYYVSAVNRSGAPCSIEADGLEIYDCIEISVGEFSFFSNDYKISAKSDASVGAYGILFFRMKEK